MDSYHYLTLSEMSRKEDDMRKIDYTMNLVSPGKNLPVRDPWYDGMNAFELVYEQLDRACEKLAETISSLVSAGR